jgi:hypothetical protein
MIQRSTKRISMRALMVDDELGTAGAEGRAARSLVQELQNRSIEVIEATSAEDGISATKSTLARATCSSSCARATTRSRSS